MSFVSISEKAAVKEICLRRAELHNAFNAEMIAELSEAFTNISSSVKAVHLRGEGKSFCAGADLAWMKSMVDFSLDENREDSLVLFDMFAAIRNCDVPVVCEVHGNAFGGGVGLVAASDVVIAHNPTRFCFSEVKLGLAPAVISPFVIQKVPEAKAREWMLTAKVFDDTEALSAGLINFSGSAEQSTKYVEETLKRLCASGSEAVRETKRLINSSKEWSWSERRTNTAQCIAERRVSAEGQEGLKSFLEKREPSWRGASK